MNIQLLSAIFYLLYLTGISSMRDKGEGSKPGPGVVTGGHKRGAKVLDETEDQQIVTVGEKTKAASSHPYDLRPKRKQVDNSKMDKREIVPVPQSTSSAAVLRDAALASASHRAEEGADGIGMEQGDGIAGAGITGGRNRRGGGGRGSGGRSGRGKKERYPAPSTWQEKPSVYPTDPSQVLPWRYYMFGLDEMIDEKIKHLQDPNMENVNLLEAKITALEEQKEAVKKVLTGTAPMTDQDRDDVECHPGYSKCGSCREPLCQAYEHKCEWHGGKCQNKGL